MCRYISITKSQTRKASSKFARERASHENFSFKHELDFLIKVSAGLWVLVAVSSVVAFIGMQSQHLVRSHGEFRQGSLLGHAGSSWRPGEYESGECGALQDRNMRRADTGQIFQLVTNPPPGYDVPYREP